MSTAKKNQPKGMSAIKVNVPQETVDWLRQKAAREGVSQQSLVAPVLNAYARGEIRQSFSQQPMPERKF